MPGCARGFPGRSNGSSTRRRCDSAGAARPFATRDGTLRYRLGRHERRAGHPVRRAGARLSQRHRQYAPPLVGGGDRRVRSRGIQCRKLCGRGGREECGREHHDGVVSECRDRERPGTAPAPAVLPGICKPAGCDSLLAGTTWRRLFGVCREELLPAERHASGDRRARAHAPAARRARAGLGQGLGHHEQYHGLHESHAAPGSAGTVAGLDVPATAAAPARYHLRDQCPLHHRSQPTLAGRQRPHSQDVADPGRPGADGAHGLSGNRRQFFRERRGGTALAAAAGRPVPRFRGLLAGAIQQQDQWRHAAALARRLQPDAGRPDHETHRRQLDHGPRRAAQAA